MNCQAPHQLRKDFPKSPITHSDERSDGKKDRIPYDSDMKIIGKEDRESIDNSVTKKKFSSFLINDILNSSTQSYHKPRNRPNYTPRNDSNEEEEEKCHNHYPHREWSSGCTSNSYSPEEMSRRYETGCCDDRFTNYQPQYTYRPTFNVYAVEPEFECQNRRCGSIDFEMSQGEDSPYMKTNQYDFYGQESPGSSSTVYSRFHQSSKKKKRTTFSKWQLTMLEETFSEHEYITGSLKRELAKRLDLSLGQIAVWFQNRRVKDRKIKHENQDDHQ